MTAADAQRALRAKCDDGSGNMKWSGVNNELRSLALSEEGYLCCFVMYSICAWCRSLVYSGHADEGYCARRITRTVAACQKGSRLASQIVCWRCKCPWVSMFLL